MRTLLCSVVSGEGIIHTAPAPPDLHVGWEGLARSVVDLANRELQLTLHTGESLILELGWSDGGDRPPADRPIVYLDQNHWVTLAQYVHAPDRVRQEADRHAAEALVRLARSGAVIFPLSSAHLTETAPTVANTVATWH